MEDIVIKVENLCKIYKLYEKPIDRLKESLHPLKKSYHRDFYALNNISFSVNKGETVGIIGKNGSGKSTLLKIITGVLTQSSGNIEINGRVSALLELGAGFNPEFTGIENIYLNGTMMGYSKEEMDKKVDSILGFADIGEFSKQPVKNYSSGMYARLAFAVAINIEPDILIVDEALSVGDIRFQQKCFKKMREFQREGTIIFVSHDIGAIKSFCDRSIWLNEGKFIADGIPSEVCEKYNAYMNYNSTIAPDYSNAITNLQNDIANIEPLTEGLNTFGVGYASIIGIGIVDELTKTKINTVRGGQRIELLIRVYVSVGIEIPILGFIIKDRLGVAILDINTESNINKLHPLVAGNCYIFKWTFDFPNIRDGMYSMDIAIAEGTVNNHIQHHWVNDALIIKVLNERKYLGSGMLYIDNIKFNEIV